MRREGPAHCEAFFLAIREEMLRAETELKIKEKDLEEAPLCPLGSLSSL